MKSSIILFLKCAEVLEHTWFCSLREAKMLWTIDPYIYTISNEQLCTRRHCSHFHKAGISVHLYLPCCCCCMLTKCVLQRENIDDTNREYKSWEIRNNDYSLLLLQTNSFLVINNITTLLQHSYQHSSLQECWININWPNTEQYNINKQAEAEVVPRSS